MRRVCGYIMKCAATMLMEWEKDDPTSPNAPTNSHEVKLRGFRLCCSHELPLHVCDAARHNVISLIPASCSYKLLHSVQCSDRYLIAR